MLDEQPSFENEQELSEGVTQAYAAPAASVSASAGSSVRAVASSASTAGFGPGIIPYTERPAEAASQESAPAPAKFDNPTVRAYEIEKDNLVPPKKAVSVSPVVLIGVGVLVVLGAAGFYFQRFKGM